MTVVAVQQMITLVREITERTHLEIDDVAAVIEKLSITGAHQIHAIRIAMPFVAVETIFKILKRIFYHEMNLKIEKP